MKRFLTREEQLEIGREVATGRAAGASWKLLERTYGRCRRQLWRYALMCAE